MSCTTGIGQKLPSGPIVIQKHTRRLLDRAVHQLLKCFEFDWMDHQPSADISQPCLFFCVCTYVDQSFLNFKHSFLFRSCLLKSIDTLNLSFDLIQCPGWSATNYSKMFQRRPKTQNAQRTYIAHRTSHILIHNYEYTSTLHIWTQFHTWITLTHLVLDKGGGLSCSRSRRPKLQR